MASIHPSRSSHRVSRRLLLALAIFGSLCAVTASTVAASHTATKPPLTIGAIEDRSGGAAVVSKPIIETLQARISQINKQGGILGRKVVLITEDDQNNPTLTPALVRRLVDRGARAVFMASGSASAVAAKSVLKSVQRVGIAPTNLNPAIAAAPDNEWSFTVAPSSAGIGQLYGLAWKSLGIKNVAIIADQAPTITGTIPSYQNAVSKLGINIVDTELVPLDSTDATPQVLRAQQKKPDAVWVLSLGNQLEVVVEKSIKRLMPTTPRFSLASIGAQPSTWALASPSDLDGLVYIDTLTQKNPRTAALTSFLKGKFGKRYVVSSYNAQADTALSLLKAAFQKAGADDPVKVRDALESIKKFSPSFGQPNFKIAYGPNRHFASAGVCGLVLGLFKGNTPGGAWPKYQPRCT
jgi:branched-chain amino acid transport system substrate-binding protein